MSSKNKDAEQLTSSQDLVEDTLLDLQRGGNLYDTNNRGDRISDSTLKEKSDEIISADLDERENPLENDLVLECLFKFLSIHDLKLLRLVSWNLNLAVDPILKNSATIVFHDYKAEALVGTFINCFKDISMSQPFVSFQFHGREFEFGKLFFQKYGKNIKKLHLTAPRNYLGGFGDPSYHIFFQCYYETFNFAPLINPSNLTKLHLQNDGETKFKFSLPNLCSIEDLLIKRHFITIEQRDRNRISPKYLHLESVVFCEGKKSLKHFCVNQLFDLGKIKQMTIISHTKWWGSMTGSQTILTVDLSSDNVIAENVTLQSTILKNLKECTWVVNDLKIRKTESDFMEKSRMKINHFTYCWALDKVLDLQCLPETIEALYIGSYDIGQIICTQPINLSNVRSLHCEFTDSWMITRLPNLLALCVNLVELWLDGDGRCDLRQIPPSVVKIKLTTEASTTRNGRDMIIIGNGKFHLQKLILENYPTDEVKQILSKLHSTELVLYMCDPLDTATPAILNFILENGNDVFKKIVIGQRKIYESTFTGDISLHFVDNSAKYYLSEDRYGNAVALTSEQFEDFTAF